MQPHRGGEEARLFTADLVRMYLRAAKRFGLQAQLLDEQADGAGIRQATIALTGSGFDAFANEGGLHSVQRLTRSRRADRIHTSIVQVTTT